MSASRCQSSAMSPASAVTSAKAVSGAAARSRSSAPRASRIEPPAVARRGCGPARGRARAGSCDDCCRHGRLPNGRPGPGIQWRLVLGTRLPAPATSRGRTANTAACVRSATPSLARRWLTWVLIVFSVIPSSKAMRLFEDPPAISSSTWRSRRVSCAGLAHDGAAGAPSPRPAARPAGGDRGSMRAAARRGERRAPARRARRP